MKELTSTDYAILVAHVTRDIARLSGRTKTNLSFLIAAAFRAEFKAEDFPDYVRPMSPYVAATNLPFLQFGLKIRKVVMDSLHLKLSDREADYFAGTGQYYRNSVVLDCYPDEPKRASAIYREQLENLQKIMSQKPATDRSKGDLIVELARMIDTYPELSGAEIADCFANSIKGRSMLKSIDVVPA